eukprot:1107511-Alexandrium_andersonii.AAC.1
MPVRGTRVVTGGSARAYSKGLDACRSARSPGVTRFRPGASRRCRFDFQVEVVLQVLVVLEK